MKNKKATPFYPAPESRQKQKILQLISISLVVAILGGAYLFVAWTRYQLMFATEAIKQAETIETLLPVSHIAGLDESRRNQDLTEYNLIKEKLARLVERTSLIHYVYLVGRQDGEMIVLVDSNLADNPNFSPLENFTEELQDSGWMPFVSRQSILTKPIKNQWGTWIRALVPLPSSDDSQIVAILGLSYSARKWNAKVWQRMIPDIIIVVCLFFLVITLAHLWQKNKMLAMQEALYRGIFEQAPIGVILQGSKSSKLHAEYISINPMAEAILGRNIADLAHTSWPEFTHPADLAAELPQFERFTQGEISSYSLEKRLIQPDGSLVWTNIKVADFSGSPLYDSMYLCLLEDISGRKESEEALEESERSKSVLISHLPGMAYRCKFDRLWTMEFVSAGSEVLTGYKPDDLIENRVIAFSEIISAEYRDVLWDEWTRSLAQQEKYSHEYEIITRFGERKWVLELGQGIYDTKGDVTALEGIILDISDQKMKEQQINYLREHDFLTGLYNRNYLDQAKKLLDQPEYWPLSILICDVDGLRMINGAYGHAEGDRLLAETAKLIQSCCRENDTLGRMSGGEFMLLLPNTDEKAAKQITQDILATVDGFNQSRLEYLYEISLSIGLGSKYTDAQSIAETIMVAEEALRGKKLLKQNSIHSAIVSSIMATLYAKSQETEEHGQRLGRICQIIGKQLGLGQKDLDDLQLLSKLHDIGKIGIDNRILNKPGKLCKEEWEDMKQHPEIGYRIAMATPRLEHIAKYILHHHERWDGRGYPQGLAGEEIPLVARVLALADAYDAMTENRIYRKALSKEAALQEITANAGTQFDPTIAELFVRTISGH